MRHLAYRKCAQKVLQPNAQPQPLAFALLRKQPPGLHLVAEVTLRAKRRELVQKFKLKLHQLVARTINPPQLLTFQVEALRDLARNLL